MSFEGGAIKIASETDKHRRTAMNYWQHRISHKWDVSKQLFDKGYLTIGWQGLSHTGILEATNKNGESGFNTCAAENGLTERNRWCLYRFFMMKPEDIVVVPLYEQEFAIVEITETAKTISELPLQTLNSISGKSVSLKQSLIYDDDNSIIDLGFYIPFNRERITIVWRAFASAKLQSRMKHQYINVDINDLAKDVEDARFAKAPLDFHDILLESAAPQVLEAIHKLTPDSFERLVKWYMEQSGASHTFIPSKNEHGKEQGADTDVIAEFAPLGIVFFIQVKKHEGYTDEWAIKQIQLYKEQKENTSDDFTYIPWVITTAKFKEEVREVAHDAGVRLIDGITFAKMILDTGVKSINEISTL